MQRSLGKWLTMTAIGFVLPISAATAAARQPKAALDGWLSRMQQRLQLPKGNADYLGAYRELIALRRAVLSTGKAPANQKAAMRRNVDDRREIAAMSRIVRDIAVKGSPPDLLRNALLPQLSIERNGAGPYGRFFDRLGVTLDLEFVASRLAREGHPRQAAEYARTAVFLMCQDDIDVARTILFGTIQSVSHIARVPGLAHWSSKFHARVQKSYDAWWAALDKVDASFTELMRPGGTRSMEAMRAAFRAATTKARGHLNWQRMLAIDARTHIARLNMRGFYATSATLRRWLSTWAQHVSRDRKMQRLERAALIRWIKEAIGP